MENDYFTWSEFVAEVKKLLPIEARRVGVGTSATDYLSSLIMQAVIDLQGAVPGFRINHETIYYPDDMVIDGAAARLVKPPQSAFRGASLFRVKDGAIDSNCEAIAHPYESRFDLIGGRVATNDGLARYSIDHAGYTMYVYPVPVDEGWHVSLRWDGQKFDFQDDEQVPFSQRAAQVVAYYVKAHTNAEVESSLPDSQRSEIKYARGKTALYLDDKEKRGEI